MRGLVGALAALVLAAGCSHIPGLGSGSAASPSPAQVGANGQPLAKPAGVLDAEVAMPAGFPTDVPIYPKARLTAGASFTSSGQIAWGLEWESTDTADKVWAFYQKQLNTGDWTFHETTHENMLMGASIARRSNPNVKGTLAVNNDSSVTTVALSLMTPA